MFCEDSHNLQIAGTLATFCTTAVHGLNGNSWRKNPRCFALQTKKTLRSQSN